MSNEDHKLIKGIIESGELERFVGVRESLYFDAKERGYNLEDPKGRIEARRQRGSERI